MRHHLLLIVAGMLLAAAGCQTQAPPPPPYTELAELIAQGSDVDVTTLRASFEAEADFPERLSRLLELEEQALALLEDEPLKLGAIGSAILDVYHGSLTGHYAMRQFYEHVSSTDAAAPHDSWIEAINGAIEAGDGSAEAPFPVMTRSEARTHLLMNGLEPVGGIYQSTDPHPFMLLTIGKPQAGPLQRSFYDASPMYTALLRGEEARAEAEQADGETTPFTLIGRLARESDTAAQAAVGAFLASRNRTDDAIGWLRASSRAGNVLANTLLARIFFDLSRTEEDSETRDSLLGETLDNYVHAIALGSSDAMYALAVLYLGEHYGEENVDAGLPLLQRAADLDHSDAMLYMAHMHAAGEYLEQSNQNAAALYARASSLNNRRALGAYTRFLIQQPEIQPDERLGEWLEAYAALDDAEAMLLLGNLSARGVSVPADNNAAVSWYRKAVKANPQDANIVNEVAWTLTVSDVDGLQRTSYAKRIMDELMNADEVARSRPEYLDTWAATYAATGSFERAIEIQELALERARETERQDVLGVLEEHLEKFRAGETVVEAAP